MSSPQGAPPGKGEATAAPGGAPQTVAAAAAAAQGQAPPVVDGHQWQHYQHPPPPQTQGATTASAGGPPPQPAGTMYYAAPAAGEQQQQQQQPPPPPQQPYYAVPTTHDQPQAATGVTVVAAATPQGSPGQQPPPLPGQTVQIHHVPYHQAPTPYGYAAPYPQAATAAGGGGGGGGPPPPPREGAPPLAATGPPAVGEPYGQAPPQPQYVPAPPTHPQGQYQYVHPGPHPPYNPQTHLHPAGYGAAAGPSPADYLHYQGYPPQQPPLQPQPSPPGAPAQGVPQIPPLGAAAAAEPQQQPTATDAGANPPAAAQPKPKRRGRVHAIPPSEAWNTRFRELQAFKEEFGHCDVPQIYKKNKALGKWVGKQREAYKLLQETGHSPLTDHRKTKLLSLGFRFYVGKGQHAKIHGTFMSETVVDKWEQKFQQLHAFRLEHGHCDVPARYSLNKPLASWVMLQRRKFREFDLANEKPSRSLIAGEGDASRELRILKDRYKRLQDLGFNFEVGIEDYGAGIGGARSQSEREGTGGSSLPKPGTSASRALRGNFGRSHEQAWTAQLEALKQYKEQHGHTNVPITYKENPSLATWVSKQREQWRHAKAGKSRVLSKDREQRLAEIGFSFVATDTTWNARYQDLKAYKEKHGSANVRDSYKDPASKALANWCRRQREAFREFLITGSGSMTNERIAKMEEVGFDWKYDQICKSVKKREENLIKQGKPIKEKRGRGRPSSKKKILQTPDMDTAALKMPPTMEASAAPSASASGEDATAAATEVDGIPQIPPMYVPMEDTEGAAAPAAKITASKTLEHRIAQAEAALATASARYGGKGDGVFNTKPEKWLQMYQQLINYLKDHGHMKTTNRFEGYNKLGPWMKAQRQDYRKFLEKKPSPMTKWRVDMLDILEFDFTITPRKNTPFETRIAEVQAFKDEYGHTNVPQSYSKNVSLGKWVSKVRDHYKAKNEGKKTALTDAKINELERIGFQWTVGRGKGIRNWDGYYEDLLKFKEKHGHMNVPLKYDGDPSLATWAEQQRVNYRNELSGKVKYVKSIVEHNAKLKGAGFDFHVNEKNYGNGKPTRKYTKRKKKEVIGAEEKGESDDEATSPKRAKMDESLDDEIVPEFDPLESTIAEI